MAKKRIYQAAKEFDLSSKALVQLLSDLGFEVKSHMSIFTDEMDKKLRKRLSREKEAAKIRAEKKDQVQKAVATAELQIKEGKEYRKTRKRRRKKKKHKGRDYAAEVRKLDEERRKRREELLKTITKEKVSETVRQTLSQLNATKKRKKYHRTARTEEGIEVVDPDIIEIHELMTTRELAERLNINPVELIGKCFKELAVIVTLNQRLDYETISLISESYEKQAKKIDIEEKIYDDEEELDESKLVHRPPVVTVMGHVDHGKTTLLDYLRNTNIVAGEVGGITQHIGAYMVETEYGYITFIDTPGHRAFTAMRARGAQVTDIVVLIIDWKDSVMPQTVEAISHARAAGVPIIIAINKMDLPDASSDNVLKQLSDLELLCDKWGGDTLCIEISAKTGMGVETLIEYIILQAELMELKANPDKLARGIVLEAKLDKGKGPTANVLIQNGTLRKGDPVVSGIYSGRIRNIFDERGKIIQEAKPSRPIQIMGINGVPEVGDFFFVAESEKRASELASQKRSIKEQQGRFRYSTTLADFYQKTTIEKEKKTLRIILKCDVEGSAEAISDMLSQFSSNEVKLAIIHKSAGNITESDILLAVASRAIILGFGVKPDARAREAAIQENVEIRLYNVIYDLEEDIKKALEGLLEPEVHEEYLGIAEILKLFRDNVVGCYIKEGVLRKNADIRISRDDEIIGEAKIVELKRFKNTVKEVIAGLECGVLIEGFKGLEVGDTFEAFIKIKIKRTLD